MTVSEGLIKKLKTKDEVSRSEIQEISKIASDEHDNLFLWHVTSTGKSGSVAKICSDPSKKVLMSHNQGIHQQNFETEAKKRGYNVSHFTHTLWNSYHKYAETAWDYIVIDEVDYNLIGHINFLKTVKYKKLVLLTGTMTPTQLKLLKKELNPFIFKITMQDIVQFGIIKEPIIYLRLIELDDTKNTVTLYKNFKTTEKKASEKFDEDMVAIQNKLKKENELLFEKLTYEKSIELLRQEYQGVTLDTNLKSLDIRYNLLKEQIDCKYSEIEFTKDIPPSILTGKMNSILYHENFYKVARDRIYHMDNWTFKNQILLGGKRKKFYEEVKMKVFKEGNFFNRLKDKRCVFFLPAVEDCEILGNSITHNSTKTNQKVIDSFNDGEINYLTTRKIINRAMSVDNIVFGCVLTFDFSGSAVRQQAGRICRSYGVPQIIIFLTKDTKEYKIFNEVFKDYGGKIQII